MLILTGPVTSKLHRMPVVTFALMGVVATLLLVQLVSEGSRTAILGQVCDLYARHAYLEADDELKALVDASPTWRYYRDRTAKLSAGEKQERQQRQMDQYWEQAKQASHGRIFCVLGFTPARPSLLGLLTFPLAHHGTVQVILVLLMMYLSAPYLEDRWGRWFLPVLFYAGSYAGLLVFWWAKPSSYTAFHGAECGVTAILAAYLVRYPREQLRYVYLIQILKRETYSTVWMLLLYWAIFQCSTAFFWRNATVHSYPGPLPLVMAFAVGAGIAVAIRSMGLEKHLYQTDFEKLPESGQLDVLIEQYASRGAAKELLATLEEAHRKYPEQESYLRGYWSQAVRMDRGSEIPVVGKRVIALDLEQGSFESAYFHWRELTEGETGHNVALTVAEHLAEGLIAIGHHLQAREVMAYAIDHLPAHLTESELLGLLETARAADPRLALSAVDRLLLEHRRPPDEATRLQTWRTELLAFHPEILQPVAERVEIEVSRDFPLAGFGNDVCEEDPFTPTRIAKFKIYRGVLQAFHDTALDFSLAGGEQLKRLPFDQVKAIWAAAIRPIGDAPDLLLDLHLDDPLVERSSHRVLRLMGREWDPLHFVPGATNKAQAVRDMLRRIIDQGRGAAMPSRAALLEQRFPVHATIQDFEATAYGVVSSPN